MRSAHSLIVPMLCMQMALPASALQQLRASVLAKSKCVQRGVPVIMQNWPGSGGGDGDFFPKGDDSLFDKSAGPLRQQIVDRGNLIQGKLGGYQQLRPAMKAAFAAVSRDGTDNGWINTADEFKLLMSSVGEDLSDEDNERLFGLCRDRKAAFNGQRPGSVVFEQWVAVMIETVPNDKPFFGLF